MTSARIWQYFLYNKVGILSDGKLFFLPINVPTSPGVGS